MSLAHEDVLSLMRIVETCWLNRCIDASPGCACSNGGETSHNGPMPWLGDGAKMVGTPPAYMQYQR